MKIIDVIKKSNVRCELEVDKMLLHESMNAILKHKTNGFNVFAFLFIQFTLALER